MLFSDRLCLKGKREAQVNSPDTNLLVDMLQQLVGSVAQLQPTVLFVDPEMTGTVALLPPSGESIMSMLPSSRPRFCGH